MSGNPMNIPPCIDRYGESRLDRAVLQSGSSAASFDALGDKGVGKSSIVRQVAMHHGVPLIDLRLTTIEPVDIRGATYANDKLAKTVWFPPEFLPRPTIPEHSLSR